MFIEGSPVIARCPLGDRSDASGEIFLTTQGLIIREHDRLRGNFGRSEISEVLIRHRILWLPLVLGGIITPLALVALIKTFAAFWLLFIMVLTGLFLMYYGYTGKDALTVSTRVKDYDFFISTITPHLRAFVSFVNRQLRNDDPNLYVRLTAEELATVQETGHIQEGRRLYLSRPERTEGIYISAINARDVEVSLRFEVDGAGNVLTFLQQSLPFSQFKEVE